MKVHLSSAYWPNLHYFYYVLNSSRAVVEWHDTYQKQSYRNRTVVLSANGPLALTIPLVHTSDRKSMQICYRQKWQINHYRAIESAYNNSPYFMYFKDEIKKFYEGEPVVSLRDYNHQQLLCILRLLKISAHVEKSAGFEGEGDHLDLREVIHPKKDVGENDPALSVLKKPYLQTFSNKFAFVPNLSILDLICNLGLEARDHLRN